jgi:hypothetical protein
MIMAIYKTNRTETIIEIIAVHGTITAEAINVNMAVHEAKAIT